MEISGILANMNRADRNEALAYLENLRQQQLAMQAYSNPAPVVPTHIHPQQQFYPQQQPHMNPSLHAPQQSLPSELRRQGERPRPLRLPGNRGEWRPSNYIPGAMQLREIQNSDYGAWSQANPNAPRRMSPGACAALSVQFLYRSFFERQIATDLGGRSLIDTIQTAYESANLVEHQAEELLIVHSGLYWTGYEDYRNDDPDDPQWPILLNTISSTVGGWYIYLANDDSDGHMISFINDGSSIYYIDPNHGIFDLGSGGGLAERVGQYMTTQHDQDELRVYAVGMQPAPIEGVRARAQQVSAGLAHRRRTSSISTHSRQQSSSSQSPYSHQQGNAAYSQPRPDPGQRPHVAELASPDEAMKRDWSVGSRFRFWDNSAGAWRYFVVRRDIRAGIDRPRWSDDFFEITLRGG
jgi:hypothetical protein